MGRIISPLFLEGIVASLVMLIIFIVLHFGLAKINSDFAASQQGLYLCVFLTSFVTISFGYIASKYIIPHDYYNISNE